MQKFISKLLGKNNVTITPIPPSKPLGILYYIDYEYDNRLKQRRLKLDKIYERIKKHN